MVLSASGNFFFPNCLECGDPEHVLTVFATKAFTMTRHLHRHRRRRHPYHRRCRCLKCASL